MNEAVSQFAAREPKPAIELIGYSGGGAVAVLIAARRTDVASIRTVAGNLDDAFVNRLHGVSSMPESRLMLPVCASPPGHQYTSHSDFACCPGETGE